MSITKENILRHELIGLDVKVCSSKNKLNLNISGKIINETHHTLDIKTKQGLKKLFKKNTTFEVRLPSNEKVMLDGSKIEKKPWDRIKS